MTPGIGAGWPAFYRWAPYVLLFLGTAVSAVTSGPLMSRGEMYPAAVLAGVALIWQASWDRRLRESPEQSRGRVVYFAVRTVLALTLSLLNPFFSIYALMGYFDAGRQLPRSLRRWGLMAVAATLAGSQSSGPGGPLPKSPLQWCVFAGLLVLHISLALVLDRLNSQAETERSHQQDTIAELKITNARLGQALAENEGLQAQLLVRAREAGSADERRRLAAEIHDTLAQGLTGIVTQLQASLDSPDQGRARTHVERAAALARHSLGEARRSVHDLTPAALEHRTLPEALEEAVARWSATSAASSELTVTGTAEPLHGEIEATLLRITEEALSNVARHAGANRVAITLSYFDDEVTLDVRDDGRGFDPAAVRPRSTTGGFGLVGMRARAARVAGAIDVESEPGGGTALAVRVPLVRNVS